MSPTQGITNHPLIQAALTAAERTAPVRNTTAGAAASSTAATSSASTTSLSSAGTLLAAANGDDVRADKVAALKSAIEAGTYNVPASAVADTLITHLLE